MSSPVSSGNAQTANMSQAYQEALQKAKQIAAKINPNAKRGLEEEKTEPEAKKVAVSTPQVYRGLEILTNTTVGVHTQLEILVPGAKVGLIIGKGGETIKYLQDKSGAKMIVVQDGPNNEGSKPLRITGETEKVEAAKEMVCDLVGEQSKDDSQSGNSNSYGGGFNDGAEFKLIVPKHAVGLVIGKGGEMIRKIQAETNAKVIFHSLKDDTFSDRECTITGKPLQVDQARRQIQDLINSTMNNQKNGGIGGGSRSGHGGNRQHNQHHNQQQQYHQQQDFWNNRNSNSQLLEFSFTVPTNKAGIIIGKGGETIKSINQQSGAHCEVDKKCLTDPNNLVNGQPVEKTFIIKGSYESVESCKQLVCDKINTILDFTPINQAAINMMNAPYPITQNYNWATAYPQQQWTTVDSSGAGAQGAGAATGGVDYSKQWADYYRSMGMVREAEMIEQNYMKSSGQGGAVAAQATAAATNSQVNGSASAAAQQADYSAQWAEYYRSIGKVKEAEAIEAQIKNKVSGGPNSATGQSLQGANDPAAAAAYQQAYAAYYQGQYNYGQYGFGANQAQQGQQPPGDSK